MVAATPSPAYQVAAATPDPEIPTLTIEDLGILRSVEYSPAEGIVVTITPTYSGCPAMREIATDVTARLRRSGFERVTVATQLAPPWSTDWITPEGKRKLAAVGIAPPPEAGLPPDVGYKAPPEGSFVSHVSSTGAPRRVGPVPLTLGRRPPSPRCPQCDSPDTRLTAQFSATACKSLHRCTACGEPFEAVKPI